MDDYPGDGSEMTGPGIGNEKRGMARTFPRFSLPGAHRLAAKYEFLILEVEAAELNLESTDALPLVASGRAGNDERCRNFSIVCDCLTRVFEGLGRNRVVGTGRDRSEKIVVETAEETQSAQDIRFGNQQQDRVAVEEGSAFQFVDEIAPSRRFIVVVTVLLPECFRIWLVLERSDDSTAIIPSLQRTPGIFFPFVFFADGFQSQGIVTRYGGEFVGVEGAGAVCAIEAVRFYFTAGKCRGEFVSSASYIAEVGV